MPARKKSWGEVKPPAGSVIDWGDPINVGLVGCWIINERAGGILRDLSAVTGNSALIAAPAWSDKKITFNGSTQYGTIPDPSSVDFGSGNFSFEAIFTARVLANGGAYMLLGKDVVGQRQLSFNLGDLQTPASLAALVWLDTAGTGITQQYTPAGSIVAGQRTHLVMQRVGASVQAFINGISVALSNGPSHTGFVTMASTSANLEIGRRTYAGFNNPFDGSIETVRIRRRALLAGEVIRLYNSPAAGILTPRRRIISAAAGFKPYWASQRSQIIGAGVL